MTQLKSYLRLSLCLLASIAILACAPTPDEWALEKANLQGDQAIRNGYTDNQTKAVVGLVSLQNGGIGSCSGTLISPNVVLTAQHCVAPTLNQINGGVDCRRTSFGKAYDPSGLYVTHQVQLTQNPSDYTAAQEVLVPPDSSFCGNDVALIVLAEPIDPADVQFMVPRVDTQIADGEKYYAVGYGATNDSGNGSGLRRRRDDLFIECVADECPSYYSRDTEWMGDTGVCQGDSGGPAFDEFDRVIGIASRGSYGCENPVYGYVFGWGEWIKTETKAAAKNAGIVAPNWSEGWPTDPVFSYPVGNICKVNSDCPSEICSETGFCTRLCNADAPCPGGYNCNGQCRADIPEPAAETNLFGCQAVNTSSLALLCIMSLLLFRPRRRNRQAQ